MELYERMVLLQLQGASRGCAVPYGDRRGTPIDTRARREVGWWVAVVQMMLLLLCCGLAAAERNRARARGMRECGSSRQEPVEAGELEGEAEGARSASRAVAAAVAVAEL